MGNVQSSENRVGNCKFRIKLGEFSTESETFSEMKGNLKQWGNASLSQGGGRPCPLQWGILGISQELFANSS